jgi:hypothetical protein
MEKISRFLHKIPENNEIKEWKNTLCFFYVIPDIITFSPYVILFFITFVNSCIYDVFLIMLETCETSNLQNTVL